MKFLLDLCVASRSLAKFLRDGGHEVITAYDIDPHASDETLLQRAYGDGQILVTEDKDFGEFVCVRGLPHGMIIRLVEMSVDEHVAALAELTERHADVLQTGALVVVTAGRIRVRR